MLLEVDGATAEYWESPGKVKVALQLAKGLVVDAEPDLGDNDTVIL
ncbi:pyridoxamine 5'-phosphate oxidase family protein [Nocardioides eburneiflavus]|nr:pyridoxamine 5'-phosphate oxidase family protein [Nocardioides eburneiflavus]